MRPVSLAISNLGMRRDRNRSVSHDPKLGRQAGIDAIMARKEKVRPILTVMSDFGFGPFLWHNRSGDDRAGVGGNCCDSVWCCGKHPMTDELLEAFRVWVDEYDTAPWTKGALVDPADPDSGYAEQPQLILNWRDFHARGLELAKRLKAEVGAAFRVVYEKPIEDPARRWEERREVLDDGSVVLLPSRAELCRDPLCYLVTRVVSGGQTGADRAALDWAMQQKFDVGGWCPQGRIAEDGVIDARYPLHEATSGGYRHRTRLNVQDSDGTMIVNLGDVDGGTLATEVFARKMGKPYLVVQLDSGISAGICAAVMTWLRRYPIQVLNVAGPRESKRPGIYRLTRKLLGSVNAMSLREWRKFQRVSLGHGQRKVAHAGRGWWKFQGASHGQRP